MHKRINYNELNDAIFMRIRLVIIAQLSVEVVGGNVEIWWGAVLDEKEWLIVELWR